MNVSHNEAGIVRINGVASTRYPITFDILKNSMLKIQAISKRGYQFERWSGDVSGTDNPIFLKVTCDKSVVASFISVNEETMEEKQNNKTQSVGESPTKLPVQLPRPPLNKPT